MAEALPDIEFLTDGSAIRVTEDGGSYRCEKLNTEEVITISYRDGRMLFNGEDVETEDFMALVGMLDTVAEMKDQHNRPAVVFVGEADMYV